MTFELIFSKLDDNWEEDSMTRFVGREILKRKIKEQKDL